MYVVKMGLVKVHKALIRLVREALSIPPLMSISEAFSALFHCNKTATQKLLNDEAWSLILS